MVAADKTTSDGSVIVTAGQFTRGDQLHDICARHRIGNSAEHKVHAPYQFVPRHMGERGSQRLLVTIGHRGVLPLQNLPDLLGRLGVGAKGVST